MIELLNYYFKMSRLQGGPPHDGSDTKQNAQSMTKYKSEPFI